MSDNLTGWIKWAVAKDTAGELGPAPDSAAGNAAYDTPDANGLVALTGLDPNSHWGQKRYAIMEVANTLPIGSQAHACASLNAINAQTENNIGGFYGVCLQVEQVTDGAGVQTWHFPAHPTSIANSQAVPSSWSVAQATAHFKALPEPGPGAGGNFLPVH